MLSHETKLVEEAAALLLSDDLTPLEKAMLSEEAALYLGVGNIARMARQMGAIKRKFIEQNYRRDSGGKFADKPDVAPKTGGKPDAPLTRKSVPGGRISRPQPERPTTGQIKRKTPKKPPVIVPDDNSEVMSFLAQGHPTNNSTETFYSQATALGGRKYSPERSIFHRAVVSAETRGKPKRKEGEAKAIFTAGGTAAGKSSYLNAHLAQFMDESVHVDPDEMKKKIPEYGAMLSRSDSSAGFRVHEESSHMAKAVQAAGTNNNQDLLIDGTGNAGPGKFAGKIRSMVDAGYQVGVRYVDAPTETAHARNIARAKKTGRLVPPQMLEENHFHSSRNIREVLEIEEADVEVWSSDTNPPTLLARRPSGAKLEIIDQEGFQRFMDKGEAIGQPSAELQQQYRQYELDALKKASANPDPEVAKRAALQIRKFEAQEAVDQLVRSYDLPYDGAVVDAAKKKMVEARVVEPEVTNLLQGVADRNGTTMAGLEFKFKGASRLTEKIAQISDQDRKDPDTVAEKEIKDALRYTMLLPEDGDASTVIMEAKSAIKKAGGHVFISDSGKCGEKDMRGADGYKGYHYQFAMQTPDGGTMPIELQFHTAASLDIKERIAHAIYEEERVLPEGHPRRALLQQQIRDTWAAVQFPSQPIEKDC